MPRIYPRRLSGTTMTAILIPGVIMIALAVAFGFGIGTLVLG